MVVKMDMSQKGSYSNACQRMLTQILKNPVVAETHDLENGCMCGMIGL